MLTQKKMFVHYSGTLAQFKESNYPTEYANSIVFIGNGEAIYAKGKYYGDVKDAIAALQQSVDGLSYFRGIKAGDVTAWAADKNGVITFTSGDNSVVTVNADTKGVHINLKQSFVDDVTNTKQGLADEITRATNAENKIKADLGTKDETKGTAFERIADIEEALADLGTGTGSIATQIQSAINAEVERANAAYDEKGAADAALAAAKADAADKYQVKGDYEAAGAANSALQSAKAYTDTEIGKLSFDAAGTAESKANAALEAAKGYADGLASNYDAAGAAAAAESAAKAYADGLASNYDAAGSAAAAQTAAVNAAKEYTDGLVEAINGVNAGLESRVKANEDAILVLNGADTVDGSVAKTVKDEINAFATNVSNNQVIDTFKELIDYAAEHTSEYSELAGIVQNNSSALEVLNGNAETAGSVAKAVKDAVDAESSRATGVEGGLDTRIKALEDDHVTEEALGNVVERLGGIDTEISGIKTTHATDKKALEDAVAAEKTARENADALKANVADVNAAVEGINAAIALKADASALTEAVNGINAEIAKKADTTALTKVTEDLQGEIKTRGEEDIRILKEAKEYTDSKVGGAEDKIKALNYVSSEGFVTKITQTDGLVSATVATSIAAEKITIADSADHFPADVANVEQALAFMANMLTWEEL